LQRPIAGKRKAKAIHRFFDTVEPLLFLGDNGFGPFVSRLFAPSRKMTAFHSPPLKKILALRLTEAICRPTPPESIFLRAQRLPPGRARPSGVWVGFSPFPHGPFFSLPKTLGSRLWYSIVWLARRNAANGTWANVFFNSGNTPVRKRANSPLTGVPHFQANTNTRRPRSPEYNCGGNF